MAKCIKDNGVECQHLYFNKHTRLFYCRHNSKRAVQIPREDLKRNFKCPLDFEKNEFQIIG